MVIKFGLTAAALLMLSICGARACDDFDDEMALAAARVAAQVVQAEATQPAVTGKVAAAVPDQSEPSSGAAVSSKPAEIQSAANLATAVRQ
jgi:hypothetical protein